MTAKPALIRCAESVSLIAERVRMLGTALVQLQREINDSGEQWATVVGANLAGEYEAARTLHQDLGELRVVGGRIVSDAINRACNQAAEVKRVLGNVTDAAQRHYRRQGRPGDNEDWAARMIEQAINECGAVHQSLSRASHSLRVVHGAQA
jgi:hypothetical protein